ncbi:MAG: segregation and condensation protein A [Paracoccaceae bacterium]
MPLSDDPPVFEAEEEALTVEVEGFEGPLDVLLDLARRQKVDLRRIAVAALAEQYLAFVEEARRRRLDLAADYLVMAAWLAWLKSRLLLPAPPAEEEPSGEVMAERLAHRLARLDAMREAGGALTGRPCLGVERFARGRPEALPQGPVRYRASLAELMRAYARLRTRDAYRPLAVEKRTEVWALEDARARLVRLLGYAPDWRALEGFLPGDWAATPERRRSAVASSFAAALELARRGRVEIRQDAAFAPVLLRPREEAGGGANGDA